MYLYNILVYLLTVTVTYDIKHFHGDNSESTYLVSDFSPSAFLFYGFPPDVLVGRHWYLL